MERANSNLRRRARQITWVTLIGMVLIIVVLVALHLLFSELEAADVLWLNLRKEGNFPTWFSTVVFAALGIAAFVAWQTERRLQRAGSFTFRWPWLWGFVGIIGFGLSLDEMTNLHDHLFREQIRETARAAGGAWSSLPLWQLMAAPLILFVFVFFMLFLANRLASSAGARRAVFAGIGCWMVALLLDGIWRTLKDLGDAWFDFQVITEEVMEIGGALLLVLAVVLYTIDLALDFDPKRYARLKQPLRANVLRGSLQVTILVGLLAGGTFLAYRVAEHRKNLRTMSVAERIEVPDRVDDSSIWFDDLLTVDPVSPAACLSATRYVATALLGARAIADDELARLEHDGGTRLVLLSATDARNPVRVEVASANGLRATLDVAIEAMRVNLDEAGWAPRAIKLDFPLRIMAEGVDLRKSLRFRRTIYGLATDAGVAFTPEEVVGSGLLSSNSIIRRDAIEDALERRGSTVRLDDARLQKIYRFETTSAFSNGAGAWPLERGHRSFNSPTVRDIDSALRLARLRLVSSMDERGGFVDRYDPVRDELRDSYSISRHAAATLQLVELYAYEPNDTLRATVVRAIESLLEATVAYPPLQTDGRYGVVDAGMIKLSAQSTAITALARFEMVTGDPAYRMIVDGLADWLRRVHNDDGSFMIYREIHPSGVVLDYESTEYEAQSVTAFVHMYELDHDATWLDLADQTAVRLLDSVEDSSDPRVILALERLYQHRPDARFTEAVDAVAANLEGQQLLRPVFPDFAGGFGATPGSGLTASASDGLFAAARLFNAANNPSRAAECLDRAFLAVGFQLQAQFRVESAMYMPSPGKCVGGFQENLLRRRLYLDDLQLNIASLLAAQEASTDRR